MTSQFPFDDERRVRLLWAGFVFSYIVAAIWSAPGRPVVDEIPHFMQIARFLQGDFGLVAFLTTIPGYHAVVAGILWLLHLHTLGSARLVSACFGLAAIYAFHLLRAQAIGKADHLATLQFAFLPILLPFDFLVYTDVMALALVLGAAVAMLAKRHWISGVLLVLSIAVRQVNVVWVVLIGVMAIWRMLDERRIESRIAHVALPYLLGIVAFACFWIWNGSISLSKSQTAFHPDFSLHTENIFFALFLIAIFLPLQVLEGCRDGIRRPGRHWLLLLCPIAAFALYWETFSVDNPLNYLSVPPFLHNELAQYSQASLVNRAGFGGIAALALLGLARTRLQPSQAWLLYPVSALGLAAAWMIEPRYALIPLSLWLAFRQMRHGAIEWATIVYWAAISTYLWVGVIQGHFMI